MKPNYKAPVAKIIDIDTEEIIAQSQLRMVLWDSNATMSSDYVETSQKNGYGSDAGSRQSDNYRTNLWGNE